MKLNNYKVVAKESIESGILHLDLSNMQTRRILNALGPLNLPNLDDLVLRMYGDPKENDDKKEIINIIKKSFPTQVKKLRIMNNGTIEIDYWLDVLQSATQRVNQEFRVNNFSASLDTFDRALKAFSQTEKILMSFCKVDTFLIDSDDGDRDFKIKKIRLSDIKNANIEDMKQIINILAKHDKLKSSLDCLSFKNSQIFEEKQVFTEELNKHIENKDFQKIKKAKFKNIYQCSSEGSE